MRYLMLLALCGCSCATAAEPPKSDTTAILQFKSSVDGLAETVGNQTAELEAVKEELKGVKTGLRAIENLLTVEGEISIKVPQAADPPEGAHGAQVDAPPVEQAGQRITFHGKPIDVDGWLATPLTNETRVGVGKKDSADRSEVEKHLRWHGLGGDFSKYSREQLITIHSVAHLRDDLKPAKTIASDPPPKKVVTSSTVITLPQNSGGCPNGQCNRPAYSFFGMRSRRR